MHANHFVAVAFTPNGPETRYSGPSKGRARAAFAASAHGYYAEQIRRDAHALAQETLKSEVK